MNAFFSQQSLLDIAGAVTELAVNWWLQSSLLIVAGLTVAHLLRSRGSAVQSVIYRTTLVAALVCPLATWILGLAGAAGWSVAMPAAYEVVAAGSPPAAEATAEPTVATIDLAPSSFQQHEPSVAHDIAALDSTGEPPVATPLPLEITEPVAAGGSPAAAVTGEPPVATGAETWEFRVSRFGAVAIAFAVVWIVATGFLLARLALAWRRLAKLRRGAYPTDEATLRECDKLATRMNVSAPEVLHSPYLPSPCLAGLHRPAVLLPDGAPDLPVRDVLIHELAHLARRDCHWNLLRRVATGVFFFQPLLWKLSQRLQATAEEVCDDYVVALGGDRHDYAHRLVDLAELSIAPMAAAGVGIVSLRSMLAQRVTRILDPSRSLSTRVGHALLAVVLLGGVAGTMLVGLVGVGPRAGVAETEAVVESETVEDAVEEESEDEDLITASGRVLAPDGKPAVGATVFAAWVFVGNEPPWPRSEPSQRFQHEIVAQTKSDADGKYELKFSKESPQEGRLSHGWHIAAFVPGMGPAWKRYIHFDKNPRQTLQLTHDQPIRGRIVDLEGKPLAGVRVSVRELRPAESDQAVIDWIADAKGKSPPSQLDDYYDFSGKYPGAFPTVRDDGGLAQASPALPTDVETDQEGRFQFAGLGANRLAVLEIEGPSVAKCYLHVVTREMESLSAKPLSFVGVRSGTYYGRDFEFVAEPTQPIEGTVTDADSGEPLANVQVRLGQFAGNLHSQEDFLATRTDEQGRYRLMGAPQGGGHRIDVVPRVDQPYFPTEKTLPTAAGSFDPITCDFELRQGKWIAGKVIDGKSGKPIVDATVHYLPLRSNEHVRNYPNYRPEITGMSPSDRYRTDEDGSFRVPAIPGAGILAAIAQGEDSHVYSALSVNEVPEHLIGEGLSTNTYHPYNVTVYHALREVELAESEDETEYDLELTRGLTRLVKLVDGSGQPVAGVRVLGRTFPSWLEEALDQPVVEIIGLRPTDERVVALVHPEKRIGKALRLSPGGEMTVALEPCAVARGRVVDEEGQPIRDVKIEVSIDHSDNWHRGLIGSTTDADGRFEVLLPPGTTYSVSHYSGQTGPNVSAECRATPGTVFELGDLAHGTELSVEETAKMMVVERPEPVRTKTSAAESDDVITVRGRVVDPDGKPVAGAAVRLPDDVSTEVQTTQTDADGRFEIVFDKAKFTEPAWHQEPWRRAYLYATAEGFAPAWVSGDELAGDLSPTLTLQPDDVPVRGQVLDLEGQPVPQAKLEIWDIHDPHSGNLDGLLETVRDSTQRVQAYTNREMRYFPGRLLELKVERGTPSREENGNPIIITDDQGRFEISGIGRERLARMWLEGPNVTSTQVKVLTRSEIDDQWKRTSLNNQTRMMLDSGAALPHVYAASFQHFAGPSVPITGVVRDKLTGEPIAGIQVNGWLRNTENHSSATTNENGRYELVGLAVGGTFQQLYAGPSSDYAGSKADIERLPYIGAQKSGLEFSATSPLSSSDTDFELARGIIVRGRVVDAATQEPVKARVEYMVTRDNPHVAALTDELWPYANAQTDSNGQFTIAVLPGPGALAVWTRLSSDLPDRYRPVDPEHFGLPVNERGWISTANQGLVRPVDYKAARFIDFEVGEEPDDVTLTVKPLSDVARVRCIDAEGQAISGVSVAGHLPWSDNFQVIPSGGLEVGRGAEAYIEIAELGAESRRPVVFRHHEKDVAAILFPSHSEHPPRLADLDRDEDGVHLITLAPAGSITGQLVDANGDPLRNGGVELHLVTGSDPRESGVEVAESPLDDEGRFELRQLPAGGPYMLGAGGKSYPGRLLKRDMQIEPGETIDLGTIDVTSKERPEPMRMKADAAANRPALKSPSEEEDRITVRGTVVDPDKQPVAGATVFAAWVRERGYAPAERFEPQILTKTSSNGDGNFELAFSTEDREGKGRGYGWQVAAFAPGMGPAWSRDTDALKEPSLTLRLTHDAPIRGRVVDLEGKPLAGVRVRIHELYPSVEEQAVLDWIEQAQEKSPPPQLSDYVHSAGDRYPKAFPTKIMGRLAHGSPALPADAVTDQDGRFQMSDLGENRLAMVELQGPFIAKCNLHVVTRDMEPLSARPLGRRGAHNGVYYGRDFEFVAGPMQPIEGTVTDIDTGQPLADVEVRVGQFAGNTYLQSDFLTTRTDEQGRYRLVGAPQGGGHRIDVVPDADQPYFPTEKTLASSSGSFDPITCDFELKQGKWIVGTVADGESGEPIVDAIVNYLPLRSNAHAQNYPNYRPKIGGSVPSERFRTAENGRFRVLAIPGAGILAAIAQGEDRLTYSTLGLDQVPEHLVGENGRLNAYHPWEVTGYHALREVELDESVDEVEYDLELTPGLTRLVKLVDASGQPVTGVRVLGRTLASFMEQPLEDSTVKIIGLRLNHERPVAFIHSDRRIGKALTISPGGEITVELQPCAVARGRFVDKDDEPVRDVDVVVSIAHNDTWGRRLVGSTTDADGRFEVLLPPGLSYHVAHYSMNGPHFSAECKGTPGAVFDLGDLTDGTKLEVEETAKRVVVERAVERPEPVRTQAVKSSVDPPFHYAGQVLDAAGQPVRGAKLYLAYWYSDQSTPPNVRTLATTNADGRFEFTMTKRDYRRTGDSVPPWTWGSIVAVAEGHGAAWAQSVVFETTGAALEDAKQRLEQQGQSVAELEKRLAADRGPLRMASDLPLEGRVVDINGQPVVGAKVQVVELRTGKDGTLDQWETASRRPGINLYEANRTADHHLYGPFVPEIFPQTRTDNDGRFTLRGLGRERLAELVVEAEGFETSEVYARLRDAEAITLADHLAGSVQVHGPKFTHVAAPSRAVEGVVKDSETGEPVAGVIVTSMRSGVSTAPGRIERAGSDHVQAVTDDEGRYRLVGLPSATRNPLTFQPPSDASYLIMPTNVDTNGAVSTPVALDVELIPGVVVTGRVVDKDTGKGVSGQIRYLTESNDDSPAGIPQWQIGRNGRSDMEGRFRFVAPKGPGYVTFTAFDDSYLKKESKPKGTQEMAEYQLYMAGGGPEYHALAKIDPAGNQKEYEIELTVERSEIITGQLLDPDGQPITASGGAYVGRLENSGWRPLDGGQFHILNFDGSRPRQLVFVDAERKLAGQLLLDAKPQAALSVRLQPAATITGRVVDEDGVPVENLSLASGRLEDLFRTSASPANRDDMPDPPLPLPPADDGYSNIETDSDGRFTIAGLLPGVEYDLSGTRHTSPFENLNGDIAQGITLEPGETRDLGTLKLQVANLREILERRQAASEAPQEKEGESAKETPQPSPDESQQSVHIDGRVVGPDGKPIAGARLYTPQFLEGEHWSIDAFKQIERARTGENGHFAFTAPQSDLPSRVEKMQVLAFAEGYGVGGAEVPRNATREEAEVSIQLVKDQPVRGRVINTEGRPVAGVRLQVTMLQLPDEGQIDEFLNGWKQNWNHAQHRMQKRLTVLGNGSFARATTDADGRFEIRGLGADRIAWLQLSGGGIAQSMCFLVTREDVDYDAVNQAAFDRVPSEMRGPEFRAQLPPRLLGPSFEFVAEPGRTISGTVRELDSKKPIPDVQIFAGVGWDSGVTAVSDQQGRYRLTGVSKGQSELVHARPRSDSALVGGSKNVPDRDGLETDGVDFLLPRGVVITGRVVDAKTGEGVPAGIRFAPLAGNEYFDKPGYDGFRHNRLMKSGDRDGRFRLVTIPGPGLLLVQASSEATKIGDRAVNPYKKATLSAQDRQHVPLRGEGREQYFTCADNSIEFLQTQNAVQYLDNSPGDEPVECEIALERGETLDVRIEDAAGKPVTGVTVARLTASSLSTLELTEPRCMLYALDPAQPRRVIFYHPQRRLGTSLTVRGDETEPVVAKLAPTPVLVGRAVDEEGEPVADAPLDLWMQDYVARELDRHLTQTRAPMTTDSEGRFELVGILPGFNFRLALGKPGTQLASDQIGKGLAEAVDGTIDLGDVRVASEASRRAAAAKAAKQAVERASEPEKTSEVAANDDALEIRGRVVGPDGQPVDGTNVAVIGMKQAVARGGDFDSYRSEAFGETTTDAEGRYQIAVNDLSSKTHQQVAVIASAEGMALAWEQLNPDAESAEASFKLQPEEVIEGRLVDIEGQPAADVRMSIESVMVAATPRLGISIYAPRDGVGFRGADDPPPAWVQPVTTDADGRFAIHNVAADHGVFVNVGGDDRFAPQNISLNTGGPEQRGERDGTYRPQVKNLRLGEEAVLPLAPAQIFEGVVRYEDTGEPAPYARLTIWASQQEEFGSMVSVAGKADAEGRYRISPKPGVRFGVTAYPPDGTPYLTRKVEPIRWQGGDTRKQVDVALPRGVLVRGKVIESKSGTPVADATVQYVPEGANNPHVADDILTGWQGIQLSNEKGEFEIVILPGPGRLLVHGPRGEYILQETSSRELDSGRPGGERNYANAIERLEPEPGVEPIDVTIEIERGAKLAGRIVDERGEPVDEALIITRLKIAPASIWWRGFPIEAFGGRFELAGLAPDEEHEVYFLDPKRRLGAKATLTANDESPTVVLKPCGKATARFVDPEGQPLQDFRAALHMVVTPGMPRYDFKAAERGELTADSDFVSNIDRANHWHLSTDKEGRVTFPALIPGATYRFNDKEFTIQSGETLDLGEREIDVNN